MLACIQGGIKSDDLRSTTKPVFNGFTLTKFDGNVVTVGAKKTVGTTSTTTACA